MVKGVFAKPMSWQLGAPTKRNALGQDARYKGQTRSCVCTSFYGIADDPGLLEPLEVVYAYAAEPYQ